jgi:hypothetical protein
MEEPKKNEQPQPPATPASPAKSSNSVAGTIAAFVVLLVVNMLGMGEIIGGNRFLTGFVIGGGTYFIVSLFDGTSASQ